MSQCMDTKIHRLFVFLSNLGTSPVNFHVQTLRHCVATFGLEWNVYPNVKQSNWYPKYMLGVVKKPFTTRNDTEKNAKITPKVRGQNGDIWEYAAPYLM